jgi:hypothetical protein
VPTHRQQACYGPPFALSFYQTGRLRDPKVITEVQTDLHPTLHSAEPSPLAVLSMCSLNLAFLHLTSSTNENGATPRVSWASWAEQKAQSTDSFLRFPLCSLFDRCKK